MHRSNAFIHRSAIRFTDASTVHKEENRRVYPADYKSKGKELSSDVVSGQFHALHKSDKAEMPRNCMACIDTENLQPFRRLFSFFEMAASTIPSPPRFKGVYLTFVACWISNRLLLARNRIVF